MAVESGAAPGLAAALELTPNQIVEFGQAVARMRGESKPAARRAGPEEFKAMILGAMAG